MAQTVCVLLDAEERTRLAAVIGDRNRPQKHVQRARIVLLSADRLAVLAVARQAGASRPAVWRWQSECRWWSGETEASGGAVGYDAALGRRCCVAYLLHT